MTATPLSPERLAEIERLCAEWPFRIGEPRAAVDAYRAIPELLAEVGRLREELGHATAHEGDWLSKTSRAMCETVLGDRDALREKVKDLTAALALARAYSPFSSEPCPLCDGETCAMHRQMDEQSATIARLARDRDHWREARSVAVEASEVLVRQRDEALREAGHATGVARSRSEAARLLAGNEVRLRDRIAALEKQVERFVAIVSATDTAASMAETIDHLAAARARIAALEDGLREACDWMGAESDEGIHEQRAARIRLLSLADGVQSSKETT